MKHLKLIFFGITTIILTGCHSGYEKRDGKVYHKWIHGGNWTKEYSLVKDADAKTFTTIKHNINTDLGKDKNHVFIDAVILEHADPNTFEQIKEYYWRDKNNVYIVRYGYTDARIKGADPKTFTIMKNEWARDKHNIYYQYDKLQNVNSKEFTAIDDDWGKDDRHYYYHELRVEALDYNTAEIVSAYYIKDKHHVFYQDTIVADANPKTFKADGIGWFGHDDKYMFHHEKNEGSITEEYRKVYIKE